MTEIPGPRIETDQDVIDCLEWEEGLMQSTEVKKLFSSAEQNRKELSEIMRGVKFQPNLSELKWNTDTILGDVEVTAVFDDRGKCIIITLTESTGESTGIALPDENDDYIEYYGHGGYDIKIGYSSRMMSPWTEGDLEHHEYGHELLYGNSSLRTTIAKLIKAVADKT